jgi:peptide/nickel transport system permease protein
MTAFLARRLAGMAAVLLAISLLTFLIFQVIPGGDPAKRMTCATPGVSIGRSTTST